MTREERLHVQSKVIDELSVIKSQADDAYYFGGSAEIIINGYKMKASTDSLAYLCDFLDEAIKDAQSDYERIKQQSNITQQ